MKQLTVIITLLTVGIHSYAQIFEYHIKRSQLKGYKKIITTQTYLSDTDSIDRKSIYYINELGDIIKTETYENATLTGWTKYEYNEKGQVTYEEDHGQIFSYDELVHGVVGKVEDDNYTAKLFEYNKDFLVKEIWFNYHDGYKTYDNDIIYEYNKYKQLTKKIQIDKYTGPVIGFEPGTDVMDTTYNKSNVTHHTAIYSYKLNTVTVAHYNEKNIIYSYIITTLSATKKPISILHTDNLKKPIDLTTITYDKNDNLIREINRVITPEKVNSDRFLGGESLTTYNEQKLPILQVTQKKGKVLLTIEFKYE